MTYKQLQEEQWNEPLHPGWSRQKLRGYRDNQGIQRKSNRTLQVAGHAKNNYRGGDQENSACYEEVRISRQNQIRHSREVQQMNEHKAQMMPETQSVAVVPSFRTRRCVCYDTTGNIKPQNCREKRLPRIPVACSRKPEPRRQRAGDRRRELQHELRSRRARAGQAFHGSTDSLRLPWNTPVDLCHVATLRFPRLVRHHPPVGAPGANALSSPGSGRTHSSKVARNPIIRWMKYALVLIDMQNESGYDLHDYPTAVAQASGVLDTAREHGIPVVYTRQINRGDGIGLPLGEPLGENGEPVSYNDRTKAIEIVDTLTPEDGEIVVDKHRWSAFYETSLDLMLRGMGITDLIIGGVVTDGCLMTSVFDAYFRGYRIHLIHDACTTTSSGLHQAAILMMANWVYELKLYSARQASAMIRGETVTPWTWSAPAEHNFSSPELAEEYGRLLFKS